MSNRTRRALRVVASSALALLTLTGFAAAGGLVTGAEATTPAPTHLTGPAPTNRPSSDGPIKVAVVLGASGTVVSVTPPGESGDSVWCVTLPGAGR
jgi:hypothetical protein